MKSGTEKLLEWRYRCWQKVFVGFPGNSRQARRARAMAISRMSDVAATLQRIREPN